MEKYLLVNPFLIGGVNKEFFGTNENEVAKEAWDELSGSILNYVPSFNFTLQRSSDDKLYHFKVKEKLKFNDKDDRVIHSSITKYDGNVSNKSEDEFMNKLINLRELENNINSVDESIIGGADDSNYKKKKNKKFKRKKYSSEEDDSDEEDDDSDVDLIKMYRKWRIKKELDTIYTPVYYWWYTPLVYSDPTIYTPITTTFYYQYDYTPVYV